MLEVILKKEVRNLGDRGEIVRVAPGYARNFLYPRELAMPATAANKRQIEEMQAAAAKQALKLHGEASQAAEMLKNVTVRAVERAGENNQLFGSVTTRDIAAKLAEQGFEIDRHKIILEQPIKEVGDYDVRIHLYRDVKVTIKVEVRAEGREDEPLVTETDEPETQEMTAEEAERAAAIQAGKLAPEEKEAQDVEGVAAAADEPSAADEEETASR